MKYVPVETQAPRLWALSPILIVVCLLISEYVGLLNPVRTWGEYIFQPGWRVGGVVYQALSWPWRWTLSSDTAARRIQDLELKYSLALSQLGDRQKLQEENEALRLLVEKTPRWEGSRLVTAPILS